VAVNFVFKHASWCLDDQRSPVSSALARHELPFGARWVTALGDRPVRDGGAVVYRGGSVDNAPRRSWSCARAV